MRSTFKGMAREEIEKKLNEMNMQIMKLNSELAAKAQSKSVGQLHKLRKTIAQAKTEISALAKEARVATAKEKKKARDDRKDG